MRTRLKLGMAVGAIALGLVAAKPAQAAIVNGGFEAFPDFTGWSTTGDAQIEASDFRVPAEGTVQAALSNTSALGGPAPVTASSIETFLGLSAGTLTSQTATNGTAIKQVGITAAAGEVVTFKYDFYTQETAPTAFNDFAFLEVNGSNFTKLADVNTAPLGLPPAITITGDNAGINSFSNVKETGYLTFNITFAAAGTYSIGLGVVNVGDTNVQSGLLLDAFAQGTGPAVGPGITVGAGGGAVPLPAGMYLMPLGLAIASLYSLKFRRSAAC